MRCPGGVTDGMPGKMVATKNMVIGPSGVRALPLAAGIHKGGHYFRYFGPSGAVQTVSDSRRPLF